MTADREIPAPLEVADVLERAAATLEVEGAWGGYSCDGPDCADTAIWTQSRDMHVDDRTQIRRFFASQIGGRDQFDIHRWNDDPDRTQAEVVAKLREVGALARQQAEARDA